MGICYCSRLTKGRRWPFALLLILPVLGQPLCAQPDANIAGLLDRYGRGDLAGVTTALESIADLRTALRQLDKIAVGWIRSEGPQAVPRRRLAVAGFALEAAHAGMNQWQEARNFVEWGCVLLRGGGLPTPPERAWHLAAVALAQGAHDPDLLTNPPGSRSGATKGFDHLRHSAFRFPDEDRFYLVRAATDEFRTLGSDPKHPRTATFEEGRQALLKVSDPREGDVFERATAQQLLSLSLDPRLTHRSVLFAARRSMWLWGLADEWKALLSRESIRTEAAIHLANTYLRLARPDLALVVLEHAPPAPGDRSLTYLTQYLAGRMADMKGDRQTAEKAYRAALAAVHGAQSATMALATLLFLSDSPDEAFELMNGLYSTAAPVGDPWREYQAGDFRLWPQRIAELRGNYRQ